MAGRKKTTKILFGDDVSRTPTSTSSKAEAAEEAAPTVSQHRRRRPLVGVLLRSHDRL